MKPTHIAAFQAVLILGVAAASQAFAADPKPMAPAAAAKGAPVPQKPAFKDVYYYSTHPGERITKVQACRNGKIPKHGTSLEVIECNAARTSEEMSFKDIGYFTNYPDVRAVKVAECTKKKVPANGQTTEAMECNSARTSRDMQISSLQRGARQLEVQIAQVEKQAAGAQATQRTAYLRQAGDLKQMKASMQAYEKALVTNTVPAQNAPATSKPVSGKASTTPQSAAPAATTAAIKKS